MRHLCKIDSKIFEYSGRMLTTLPPLNEFLGVRFASRGLLLNKAFHISQNTISKDSIIPEKEPYIRGYLSQYAKQICENPNCILKDDYSLIDRKRDWLSLVNKQMLDETGEIINIDTRSRPGHKILDYHMPHFWEVKNHKGISVKSLITQANLEKALLFNLQMHSTPYYTEIRRMLVMTGGLGNVTKYRTVTTKGIVQYFKAKRIFDPCVGWGGRMLGTLAAGTDTYYVGCEPDENTSNGLINILSDESMPSEVRNRGEVWNEPVEKVLPLINEKFDMILTSPPYYNLELYTSGEQSTTQYSTWEAWVEKWLKPTILGCLKLLSDNGTSCWSVKNFKSDKKYPLADITKKIHEEAGWKLVKTVTMRGSARMGAQRIEDGGATRQSEEETFCFKRV